MGIFSRAAKAVKKLFGGGHERPEERPPEPPKEPPKPPPPPPFPPEPPKEKLPPPDEEDDRQYWTDRVIGRKEEIWGDTGRYNPQRAARYVRRGTEKNVFNPPSIELLQWAATAPEDQLHIMIRMGGDYSFLFYK